MSKEKFIKRVVEAADEYADSVTAPSVDYRSMFPVNCEVVIVSDGNCPDNVGLHGIVVGYDDTKVRDKIAVEVVGEDPLEVFDGGHDCDGMADEITGRYFAVDNLKFRYSFCFRPDDYARVFVDKSRPENEGKACLVVGRFWRDDVLWVSLECPEKLAGGHTLDGAVSGKHGRNYPASQLTHINGC